jgi:alkanesulfonate monooxygenase SsuD/methylene tetrahydromethanopterin reductase-like flavin-dependent oxidoreductase (luciferase family)
MVGVNVMAAETDAEARRRFTGVEQSFAYLRRGRPGLLPPAIDDVDAVLTPAKQAQVGHVLSRSLVGSPRTVRAGLDRLLAQTKADELMVVGAMYEHAARLHSFEILADVVRSTDVAPKSQTDAA